MNGFSTPVGQCLLCGMHQVPIQHNYISSLKGTIFQNETTKMQRIRFTLLAEQANEPNG